MQSYKIRHILKSPFITVLYQILPIHLHIYKYTYIYIWNL